MGQFGINKKVFKTALALVGMWAILPQISAMAQDNPPEKVEENSDKLNPVKEVAGGVEKEFVAPKYAVMNTGKTLPEGIFRALFINAKTFGTSGFSETGKKGKFGMDYDRWMGGLQVEYGLTNKISLAMGIPYVYSNHLALTDSDAFASTEFYSKYYNKLVKDVSGLLNLPNDYINSGKPSPGLIPITLPTGEKNPINKGAILKDEFRKIIETAAMPSKGATGIGDLQLGFLWNAIAEDSPIRNVPVFFSLGGGLRMPTGKFNLASAMRSTGGDATLITGGGTFDAIVRWNVDYVATPGFILSWQHQMELSLSSAKLDRSSMKDPTQFNTADPKSIPTGFLKPGDLVDNSLTFKRKGVHEIGFLQAAWGVGNVDEKLKWLGVYTQAKYNIAAQAYLNDAPIYAVGDQFYLDQSEMHKDYGYEQYYSAVIGTKISGLPYKFPLEFSVEFEYPFAGKNRLISPMNAQAVVGLYF